MFVLPTIITEIFNSLGKLKINDVVGIDGVSAEVLKTSLPVIFFVIEILFLTLFCGWFPKS